MSEREREKKKHYERLNERCKEIRIETRTGNTKKPEIRKSKREEEKHAERDKITDLFARFT